MFKVKVAAKVQNVSECQDDMFRTIEHFVTKPGMVMQHHRPEGHAETLIGSLCSMSRSQQGLV